MIQMFIFVVKEKSDTRNWRQKFHTEPMVFHKGIQLNIETGVMQM